MVTKILTSNMNFPTEKGG